MENNMYNKSVNELNISSTCLICWENINTQKWCKCVTCNIMLHDLCEKLYRGEKKYCECPHCRRIGTIGK